MGKSIKQKEITMDIKTFYNEYITSDSKSETKKKIMAFHNFFLNAATSGVNIEGKDGFTILREAGLLKKVLKKDIPEDDFQIRVCFEMGTPYCWISNLGGVLASI